MLETRNPGDPEPGGLFAGAKLPECQCHEGSLGCLGPPCVTEAQVMTPGDVEAFDREMRKAVDSVALDSCLAGWGF